MSLYNQMNNSSAESPKRANCTGAPPHKALLLLQVLLLLGLFSFPTTHAQEYSIGPVVPSPTPPIVETEERQVDPSPEEQGLPLQTLQVDGIQMILSGVSTLSSASQTTWAQTTIDFVAATVGQALVEQTVGYVELALQMGAWTMSVTNDGELLMEFALTLNIKSSTTFTQESGERIILNGFDDDEEKFAYITALKNTQDAAFENAVDVVVTIDDEDQGDEDEETTPPVETTDPPTVSPTIKPTVSITVVEPTTEAPVTTEAPTMSPTTPDPTVAPTSAPSPPPGAPTAAPTLSPPPTTASPTAAATLPLQRFQAKNIEMVLEGMQPLYLVAQSIWQDETAAFIETEIADMLSSQETAGVSIDFTSQDPPYEGRRLQQDATEVLKVKFDAVVSIRSESEDHDVNEYITSAFDSPEQEEMYIDILKTTGYEAFDNLSGVSITTTQDAEAGEEPSPAPPPSNNNLGTTIGISVGLVLVACIASAALAFFIVSRRKEKKPSRADSPLSTAVDSHHGMHYADEIEVGSRSDISTLGDPIPAGMRYGDVCEGGTMFTAATDGLSTDYDFQKAFHRSQLSVTSTLGGDSELGSDFIPKDSLSLDEEYLRKNQFEVDAPAGLLGLVIDTSEEGYPTIRAIKESSCLTGQVQVGDILLSVDNEDVTPMMASTVSRLISSKSQNSVRRFVFSRLEEEGMA